MYRYTYIHIDARHTYTFSTHEEFCPHIYIHVLRLSYIRLVSLDEGTLSASELFSLGGATFPGSSQQATSVQGTPGLGLRVRCGYVMSLGIPIYIHLYMYICNVNQHMYICIYIYRYGIIDSCNEDVHVDNEIHRCTYNVSGACVRAYIYIYIFIYIHIYI